MYPKKQNNLMQDLLAMDSIVGGVTFVTLFNYISLSFSPSGVLK